MFGLSTKALVIVTGLLVASVGVSVFLGWRLTAAHEALGAAESRIEEKNKMLESQEGVITSLKELRSQDQDKVLGLSAGYDELEQRVSKVKEQLSNWRGSLASRTLKKPEVTQRAANIALIRWMRGICRSTRGDNDECNDR